MNIGLGTASFGTTIPEDTSWALMDEFVALGGTVIDTANNYAFWQGDGGESEQVIGRWLSRVGRDSVEIHTKIGAQPLDGKNLDTAEGLSRATITKAVEGSLRRLGVDYVDVLYTHVDDRKTPLSETWETLSELHKNGVVKRLGISNYVATRVKELIDFIAAHQLSRFEIAQYRYSVIPPQLGAEFGIQICLDDDLKQILGDYDAQIVAYSPLLNGAFEEGQELPAKYQGSENDAAVDKIRAEASKRGASPSAIVLKRIADEGIFPLTMTGKMERLRANLQLFT